MIRIPLKWIVAVVLTLLVAGGAAWYGYVLPVERITIVDAQHADADQLLRLARADTSMAMHEVDAGLVADRVRRHPWVASANVLRMPDGTLRIRVTERTPVALALDGNGDAAFYLDARGYAMPATDAAVFYVPLVRGVQSPSHPTRPVASAALRALLVDLAAMDEEEATLTAEFVVTRGGIDAWTPATPSGRSLRVRLGDHSFARKISALDVFWHQSLLTHPTRDVATIDLRFDGQLITTGGDA